MTEPAPALPGNAVADYVTARAGLAFVGAREAVLRDALSTAVGTDATLATPPLDRTAFARLCDSITVQESFFFRESAKLALLRERLLDPARGGGGPVRVWSAGCAAGEEAYTLAAVLNDAGFAGRYAVLGTDLSGAAVAAARRGTYGRWALRGLDDRTVARLFAVEGEQFRVRDHLRTGVEFLQHNLLEPLPTDAGPFDVIFCRNVLIYLTPEAVARAATMLSAALAPGGWLVTGVAGPLLDRVHGLETVVTDHGLAYQRTGSGRRRPPARMKVPPVSPREPIELAHDADIPSLLARATQALDEARPGTAVRLARRVLDVAPRLREAHCLLVLALAQGGMLADSLEAAAQAVQAFPADGDVHHLHAVMLMEAGDVAGAGRAATRAVQLSPGLVPAHLLLARVHGLLGHDDEARSARRQVRRLLAVEVGTR